MLGVDTIKRVKNKGNLQILENIRSGHYQTSKKSKENYKYLRMLGADTLKRLKNKGKLHILENIRSGHYQTNKK